MNNESTKSPKPIITVSNTSASANNNYSTSSISSSTITATSFSSISSPLSLSSSATQSYSTSAQFDVAVSAIAAVVNASNNLPVTTPPSAAAVVAVAVSSLAAAIIPDTPIVSIAGSTLSEITTTTTSTKTTPTPIPTTKETGNSNNNNNNTLNGNCNKTLNNKDLQNKTSPSSSTSSVHPSSSSYSTLIASVKDLEPMSVANTFVTGDLTNASTTVANAAAAENENNTNSIKQIKDNSKTNTAKGSVSTSCGTAVAKTDSPSTAIELKSIISTTTSTSSSSSQPVNTKATVVSTSKTDDINVTPNETKSKDFLSESWEESRIKDWDDSKLKELLDEAYSYKNPRDKENKSKTFLQLLEKAENEDQSYPFCVTSLGSRNLSNSIASSNYYHYQPNTHYQSHSHNHNRSHHHHHHHHHKQGGSLQDLLEIGLHESQFDCDQTFGIGISGNQRTRRQNHNSRQKKFSSSVSSRQREGGSLPSNVNVTHQLSAGGGSAVVNDLGLMQQEIATANVTTNANTGKASKKEQRRNASKAAATNSTAIACSEAKEYNSISSVEEINANTKNITTGESEAAATTNSSYTASGGDFIIDMGEPMMDIQQQQKILQCKGQDASTQGQPFYERLANNDKRIPRANIIGATKGTYFAPTTSHCYVDETVRFNALERNGGTNNGPTSSAIDAKFLPLDENYKSCKSVLGSDSDKSQEILLGKSKSNTIYTKISSPASGSAILTGTTNNIATLTQRQLDENGNALSEIYQNSSGAGSGSASGSGATIQINAVSPTAHNASAALLNYCSNVSTSATVTISPHTASTTVSTSATVTTTFTSGPSQAKAKAKKKSQQERNTKTVDVESVAGYRGKDPVEELVKYIESSGEDKQAGSGSGSKSGDKKKERKKDKEKHQKLKKSNSLEELRSGAKMEVHELKRTAATTESNAVLVRQKNGGGGKQNKNNSSSAADINKNVEGKNSTQATNSRKTDRRSWGNEDLKYLEDQQNANLTNEDKLSTNTATTTATTTITTTSTATNTNSAKERKNKIGGGGGGSAIITTSAKEEKETKDKTSERNERNFANNIIVTTTTTTIPIEKSDKLEKTEKTEKMEKSDKNEKSENKLEKSEKRKKQDIPPNAVTVVDILAIESVLPETAEFHVVTKKKKPKKQKVINNLEETTVTFNRTHNFTMQKTSTFNQQQQQMTVRYKYYHHDNSSSNAGISNTNTNSQNQYHQQTSSQQHQQSVNHNQQQQQQQSQQQPQQQQQQQKHNSTESFTNTIKDKSRRKSTSSVPPSEKSDSSDLDSVHSLPIESSSSSSSAKTNATTNTTLNMAKVNTQQRTKIAKNISNSNNNNNTILLNSNSLATTTTSQSNKNQNLPPAPISYADIARTNKEIADAAAASASGILINNNEISTECRNADALTTDLLNTEIKTATAAATTATAVQTVAIPTTATNKSHKNNKKIQIKQDFPELGVTVAATAINDDKVLLSAKTITYSQSLIAVTNSSQNTSAANQSQTSGGDGGGGSVNVGVAAAVSVGGLSTASDIAPSSFSTSSSDINTKVSMTDQHKNLIVHQHVNIPPLQHPQQQILQKFRTVENDTIATTSTNASSVSSSAATYMASIKSNSLDQQYPALEKTVKRHSSANVSMMGATSANTNASNQAPINFAAAAKQQISTNVAAEQQNILINSNKNSALTTSNTNTNNNNTIQVAFLPSSNINAKMQKSKEKSPPLLSATNLIATIQQTAVDTSSFNATATATSTGTTAAIVNTKRSKRERQQQQQLQHLQHLQLQQNPADCTQTKPNQSNTISNRKLIKTQLKSSNSLPLGLASLTGATSTTTSNRPAVIILNDDRNTGICTADNQFTFGDFNEEELKLFDDDHNTAVTENRAENIDINANQSEEEDKQREQKQQMPNSSEAAIKSPSAMYFNDSGTSCNNEMANNSTSDMLLSSSIEASSPNTSFVANSHSNNGATALNMPALNNNQSSDSGIYTDKTKSSNSSCSSSSSRGVGADAGTSGGGVGVEGCSNDVVATKHKQKQNQNQIQIQNQQITPTKEENHKLNTFLSSTGCASSVHTSMDNLNPPPPPPPPQQLETCNDIETAIIAAARAAAKQHHPPLLHNHHHHHQQQQQQYKNSNTSSNSSSFSSSSISSTSSAYQQHHHHQHKQQQQQQHHSTNVSSSSSKKIYPNQHGRNNIMSYNQQSTNQPYDEDYDNNDDDNDADNDNDNDNDDIDSFANTPRSRSPSRSRRISIAGGKVANKEFDIHFIPPTTMPTAFSTQQHNDIIIDFIGSAWEEVANSKVTKVYDGQ